MSNTEKLYVDASRPATLRHAGTAMDCPTLAEAVIEYHKLPADQREHATININTVDGQVYSAREIDRLHYGPKPK